jgi:outer membrane immunogenic protein
MTTLKFSAVLAATMFAGAAMAADLPVPIYKAAPAVQVHDWTGLYVGAHAGYGWSGRQTAATTALPSPAAFDQADFSVGLDTNGFIGGAQIGFNRQVSRRWMLGFEADFSHAGLDNDARVAPVNLASGNPVLGSFADFHQELKWLATIRGRVGFLAAERLMLFGTGGLAVGKTSYSVFEEYTNLDTARFSGAASKTKIGWTLGAGAEWAFAGNWSAKLEYLYYNLGEETVLSSPLAPNPPFALQTTFETNGHIARLGINYKFGSGR